MAQEFQFVCDGCGDTVHGKHKAAFISKDYLQIKGTLILQIAATKTNLKDHYFLTKKYDGTPPELIFCMKPGLPCIEMYIEAKRRFVDEKRSQELRNEATNRRFRDLDHPEFTIGHKA